MAGVLQTMRLQDLDKIRNDLGELMEAMISDREVPPYYVNDIAEIYELTLELIKWES